ncbi:MAG: hypothetical protein AAF757_13980, partial [Cyanobacteria bacterium P01_D01_bin.116]
LVRDTEYLISTFKINQSVTCNGNKGGRKSTPLFASPTRKCAGCVSPKNILELRISNCPNKADFSSFVN